MTTPTCGVLLMAYGGLDSLDNLEPYLKHILGGRPVSPALVKEMHRRYTLIGGRSPLLERTLEQADALENQLNENPGQTGENYRVYVGMRHWKPWIKDTLQEMVNEGIQQVIALCMTPHASQLTTGAYRKALKTARASLDADLEVTFIEHWHDQPLFIQAHVNALTEALSRVPKKYHATTRIVYTAHSLPMARTAPTDPYTPQLLETAAAISHHLTTAGCDWQLCYQSAPQGAANWLEPQIEDCIHKLASQNCTHIIVDPIGFVSDHIELLYDLDIEAVLAAREYGLSLVRTTAMNAEPVFIKALAAVVKDSQVLKGVKQNA